MTIWTWSIIVALLNLPFVDGASSISTGLSDETIALVRENLLQSANTSWELGTAAEALTELTWPALSVFAPGSIPPPTSLNATLNATDVLGIAYRTIQAKPSNAMTLVGSDGAVGDPASLGVAVLLANWTRSNLTDTRYSTAASQQLTYLVNDTLRTWDGAISQRTNQVQLWADFVYMAPPFIAYMGALQGGDYGLSLLQLAYDQCRLYRNYLRDDDTGLWKHVVLGSWQDDSLWGTGNGWAAAGMLRVLETMQHSDLGPYLGGQQQNLTTWIQEIVNATWTYQADNGTLYNVLNEPTTFVDSSCTALLASVTYRIAALTNDTTYVDSADRAFNLIEASIDEYGWLQNTVNPYTFDTPNAPGTHSPEGQAFALLLHSAWRDYAALIAGSTNVSSI